MAIGQPPLTSTSDLGVNSKVLYDVTFPCRVMLDKRRNLYSILLHLLNIQFNIMFSLIVAKSEHVQATVSLSSQSSPHHSSSVSALSQSSGFVRSRSSAPSGYFHAHIE